MGVVAVHTFAEGIPAMGGVHAVTKCAAVLGATRKTNAAQVAAASLAIVIRMVEFAVSAALVPRPHHLQRHLQRQNQQLPEPLQQ